MSLSLHRVDPTRKNGQSQNGDVRESKNYITALERGLSVMGAFGNQGDKLTLAEISRIVDLPRAAARRCLITLTALNYIEKSGRYFRLSPKVLSLAQAYLSSSSLPQASQKYVEQVSSDIGESCSVSVLLGDEVFFVARSSRPRNAATARGRGLKVPAYCSSMGRVLLANLSHSDLKAYFSRTQLRRFNQKTVTDRAGLKQILENVRRDDYCVIDGEFEAELRAIAIPIRDTSGNVVAAMNVRTEPSRLSKKQLQTEILPVMRKVASEIRHSLVSP